MHKHHPQFVRIACSQRCPAQNNAARCRGSSHILTHWQSIETCKTLLLATAACKVNSCARQSHLQENPFFTTLFLLSKNQNKQFKLSSTEYGEIEFMRCTGRPARMRSNLLLFARVLSYSYIFKLYRRRSQEAKSTDCLDTWCSLTWFRPSTWMNSDIRLKTCRSCWREILSFALFGIVVASLRDRVSDFHI